MEAVGVSTWFGPVQALDGVSVAARPGAVLGLLGHNGAGKTTLVNVLATLCRPAAGTARVAGYDVVRQSREVRRRIALTGQFAAVDEQISGRDNLVLVARLRGTGRRAALRRAAELLEMFDLTGAADRPVRGYSGGMRRRLDLAASLTGRPEVLFLDEPTTGLDPAARLATWAIVEDLVRDGTTVVLTTQYLDEADRLADTIAVLAGGRVVATGAPADLKARVGGRTATARLSGRDAVRAAARALRLEGLGPEYDPRRDVLAVPLTGPRDLAVVARTLDAEVAGDYELAVTAPTLDDVYLSLIGPRRPDASAGAVSAPDASARDAAVGNAS
ncbi:ATP-binding cassette domain-containing protein [Actinomadura nitritigenes]|uniref:ATP-binding cassette domain-containing protein n=1 Tax=Actinomadura nitritigenes TaxID=134602 RepID=A0ABS3R960_9ACTN|nr:ATP-binding cassette domain-containing protein [Actinomadura nitritigenes]